MTRPIQEHPAYHEGFFDAMDLEPLFEGECSPEYEAGWRAYWTVRDVLNDPAFLDDRANVLKLPADRYFSPAIGDA